MSHLAFLILPAGLRAGLWRTLLLAPRRWVAPLFACALLLSLGAAPGFAGLVTWTGGAGDSLWRSAGNWSTGKLPGSGDDVVIDDNPAVVSNVVYDITGSIKSLTLDPDDSLELKDGSPLRLTAGGLNSGRLTIQGFPNSRLFLGDFTTNFRFTNGGTLTNFGTLANDDGFGHVFTGTLINDNGATLTNWGLLGIGNGATFVNFAGGTLTNNKNFLFGGDSGDTFFNFGRLDNNRTLDIGGGSGAVFKNFGRLTNRDTLNNFFGGRLTNFGRLDNSQGTLTNGAGATLTNEGTLTNFLDTTLTNKGTLINNDVLINNFRGRLDNLGLLTNNVMLTNNGFLTNDAFLGNGGTLTNFGTLTNTGLLTNGGTLANFAGGTLTNTGELDNFGTLTNNGTLANYLAINNFGAFTNAGTVQINSGSAVTGTGTYTQTAGSTTVDGQLQAGQVDIQAGTLTVENGGLVAAGTLASPGPITIGTSGKVTVTNGTLQGNVVNNGNLDPLGRINIVGNYTQTPLGVLVLDVAGTGPGQFGQLTISGTGVFNGPIDLDFIDGFAPVTGDTFDFIHAAGGADFSGANVNILGLLPDFQFTATFSNGTFLLRADSNGVFTVPEPSTLALYGTGLLGLVGAWHRRRPGFNRRQRLPRFEPPRAVVLSRQETA